MVFVMSPIRPSAVLWDLQGGFTAELREDDPRWTSWDRLDAAMGDLAAVAENLEGELVRKQKEDARSHLTLVPEEPIDDETDES